MSNALKPIYEINQNLKIEPYDCKIADNMRVVIKVKVNKDSDKKAVVIGINPSRACNGESDTTLTKISRYLYQYGIGELTMINLFETISTDQGEIDFEQKCDLEKHEQLLSKADMIVVAWGTEDKYLQEKESASQYLLQWCEKVYCIEDKKGNKPRHPSRISYSDSFVKYFADDVKRKIDMADEIFVINVGDYIGDSTKSEIAYAKKLGIPVRYLEAHMEK